MAYRRRRRSPTKGRRCTRYKRVRVRGVGMARRCAKYGPKRAAAPRKRRRATTRRRTYRRRKPAGMARRGSKCVRFKRVRVRGGGTQRRCAKYRAR